MRLRCTYRFKDFIVLINRFGFYSLWQFSLQGEQRSVPILMLHRSGLS